MDNVVDALIMSFAMFVFVIALTATMYMFNQVATTSEIVLYVSDRTNYFENIEIDEANLNITTRIVDLDTIIPTLYRYYKENFCVKICDDREGQNELIQLFDVNIEGELRIAESATRPTKKQDALVAAYGDNTEPRYLFEAPWIGNTESDTKTRIDLYVKGGAGYINDTYVDYRNKDTGEALETLDSLDEIRQLIEQRDASGNPVYEITESFVEYVFSGDTKSTEDGTETITGDKQEEAKIIITYTIRKA